MSEVAQLELQRDNNQKVIAFADAVERLLLNPDFKTVFIDGFCRDDAAAYVQVSQDPNIAHEQQMDALRLAQASGHVKRYLQVKAQLGNRARHSRDELDAAITAARQEEA